jgi:hypothetical protein
LKDEYRDDTESLRLTLEKMTKAYSDLLEKYDQLIEEQEQDQEVEKDSSEDNV